MSKPDPLPLVSHEKSIPSHMDGSKSCSAFDFNKSSVACISSAILSDDVVYHTRLTGDRQVQRLCYRPIHRLVVRDVVARSEQRRGEAA